MTEKNPKNWQLNRQVNLSVLIQLMFLASLIVGSWMNLQRQLDLLHHDVTILLENNDRFQKKTESLWDKSISHEYRMQALEKRLTSINKKMF